MILLTVVLSSIWTWRRLKTNSLPLLHLFLAGPSTIHQMLHQFPMDVQVTIHCRWKKVICTCTHEQSLTNCMMLWYESMWTIQVRVYLRTYEDHESQYSVLYRYQYLATSVCDYTMNIFLVQTTSLVNFNVCFPLGQCHKTFPLLFSSM